MRVVVWGVGVAESRMLWERAVATPAAVRLAEALSPTWRGRQRPDRWAVEVDCPEGDDVLRLVEETSADESVLGWSPAPRHPSLWAAEAESDLPSDWL
jgi:hypothetical protein